MDSKKDSGSHPSEATEWKVDPAREEDLPSIGTIHARAFHPTREWHRKVFPSSVAPWWEEKYGLELEDPTVHVLKITSLNPALSNNVLGLLCMRKYEADERGAGRWSSFPSPPGVDRDTYDFMIRSMIEHREKMMLGRPHLAIDHFGVDNEYQGRGLGKRLLAKACEVADEEKLDCFVEANEFAESFYQQFGFKTERKDSMPGGLVECFLVRKPSGD